MKILEILYKEMEDYCCQVRNKSEVQNLLELCKDVFPSVQINKANMIVFGPYCFFKLRRDNAQIVPSVSMYQAKVMISYTDMVSKLKVMKERNACGNLGLTAQEILFLKTLLGYSNHRSVLETITEYNSFSDHENLIESLKTNNKNFLNSCYNKFSEYVFENGITDEIFRPKKNEFSFKFKNGLTAKIEGGNVCIGCKKYEKEFIFKKLAPVVETMGLNFEGYVFEQEECVAFINKLRKFDD